VDLAGGTGDVARLLAREGGRRVIVVDASVEMMKAGRAAHPHCSAPLSWVAAEGERLPFADDALDCITVAFGLRNMSDPDAALEEVLRVLKPGGRFYCLEFSKPHWWLKPFYDLYSFLVIPRLGAWVAGEPSAYRYLIESIRRFPGQKALTNKMRYAGFSDVRWRNVSFGIAAIHWARKAGAARPVPAAIAGEGAA
jgi:demethylmenaquinone methyltransferase/2-methoxy-6-polyprenyl-1,4-benzoquinol methylase